MSYAEQLAAFRAAHQDIETAEVYVTDLNGVARGKLVLAAMLEKLSGGGMKMPTSTLGLDIFGADCEAAGIALDKGDPDGNLIPVGPSLAPLAWAERPTAQIQCMLSAPDGEGVCGYDPRGVLARVAERTQVIFFTHHEHLLRLADDHLHEDQLAVHRIDAATVRRTSQAAL